MLLFSSELAAFLFYTREDGTALLRTSGERSNSLGVAGSGASAAASGRSPSIFAGCHMSSGSVGRVIFPHQKP